ncbi:GNAT family N-acetyltransferase [Deinococcus sp. Arct2-2]|uniref:GNAT family N-acetyltransferase n=1 Tax=Deinococcus sp. Arct2-2 TaxID=2568653 RepID=UPI0010A56E5F|nr:GNAT family N-acetyltransferase [Deinococcus sp. Arct2-2]THF71223.1 GNAT family N-acetyltransferase [Deinococcus sp. Arct2-2]
MTAPLTVRALTAADAPAYRAVRLASLENDPAAFITTAAEFAARSLPDVTAQLAPTELAVTFGAFAEADLVGLLTVACESRPTLAHRANVFGVSVLPAARGRGAGAALLDAGLAQIRIWSGVTVVLLGVTETQHAARRLYERHGFTVWGTQPEAVQGAGGVVLAEHHMLLRV